MGPREETTVSNPAGSAPRWPALVVIIGAVGVAVTVAVAMSADWGPPGIAEYRGYEALNRRVAVPALALLVGLLALRHRQPRDIRASRTFATRLAAIGAGLALAGNVGEFWLFTSAAYGDGLRNLAWTTFGLGVMTLLASAVVAVVGMLRDRIGPRPSAAR